MPVLEKGSSVKGKVTGIEKYGFFILTEEGYTGLIHISEMSDKFVNDVNDYVKIDDVVYAKVIDVDEEKKQIKLTIKNYDYRIGKDNVVVDINGFNVLANMLPIWIDEYKKKKKGNC